MSKKQKVKINQKEEGFLRLVVIVALFLLLNIVTTGNASAATSSSSFSFAPDELNVTGYSSNSNSYQLADSVDFYIAGDSGSNSYRLMDGTLGLAFYPPSGEEQDEDDGNEEDDGGSISIGPSPGAEAGDSVNLGPGHSAYTAPGEITLGPPSSGEETAGTSPAEIPIVSKPVAGEEGELGDRLDLSEGEVRLEKPSEKTTPYAYASLLKAQIFASVAFWLLLLLLLLILLIGILRKAYKKYFKKNK